MHRTLIRLAAWLFPLMLALLFLLKGRFYDPAFFVPPSMAAGLQVPAAVGDWMLEYGSSLPADRMYEKINGKAGYYIQYGAEELSTGEWVAGDQRWDMYLYRFTEAKGARAAYQGERASDGRLVEDLTGYTVPGQVTIHAGTFYLQLVAQAAAANTEPAVGLARSLAELLDDSDVEEAVSDGVDLVVLAGEEAISNAEDLLPEDAFGFSALADVRTLEAEIDGDPAVWFTAPGDTETVTAFFGELKMYGGEELFSEEGSSGGSMYGSWVLAGVLDGAVWGVHAAPSREALMKHWRILKERVEAP